MKKIYEKPDVECVSLAANENVASDWIDGNTGLSDNIFTKPTK